ncbi:GntR family transcriptional regulator [Pseudaestuariivita atlantica]|uniref:GntR family transcriptional regulator n=1 Tax=Pseudaestuariivita atlantica TaxID=1317121 RepID=A0A0L1JNA8_9RHOB|nr:GntR family transcriptional regulator [Pseudaestuariivita atlantica]KNG93239.1 GntR family transcriptional regulator [Pseudaestuariivita atlantica]
MPRPAKDLCLENLRHRILMCDLEPGADLDEVSLADRYGLSRTPLREVLQRLAGDGYVTLKPNRGAKVAPMNVVAMRTFFQTAPMVYANIGRLAAENRTPEQLDHLKSAQTAFRNGVAARDPGATAAANHQFHAVIGEMAHNPYLTAALARLLIDHTRLSQTFYRPASPAEQVLVVKAGDQHDAMISAIEAQEPALVTDLTLQHWDLSRDRLERFVRPDPLPVDVIPFKDKSHAV